MHIICVHGREGLHWVSSPANKLQKIPYICFSLQAKCLHKARKHYGRNVLLHKNYNWSSYEWSKFSCLLSIVILPWRLSSKTSKLSFICFCFFFPWYKYLTVSAFYFSFLKLFWALWVCLYSYLFTSHINTYTCIHVLWFVQRDFVHWW